MSYRKATERELEIIDAKYRGPIQRVVREYLVGELASVVAAAALAAVTMFLSLENWRFVAAAPALFLLFITFKCRRKATLFIDFLDCLSANDFEVLDCEATNVRKTDTEYLCKIELRSLEGETLAGEYSGELYGEITPWTFKTSKLLLVKFPFKQLTQEVVPIG